MNETQKLMTVEEIIKFIEEMPFNTAYAAIASDYDEFNENEGEGWWSIIKLEYADAKTLLFDYFGGGYPCAYCIDGQCAEDTVESAVISFLKTNVSFHDTDSKYVVDTEIKNIDEE